MRIKALLAAIGGSALFVSAPAAATSFETAADFNLFVIGNANVQGSDVEGRLAVGGDANLLPYTVNQAGPASGTNLVVGGNLTSTGGSIVGSAIVGGNATVSQTGSIANLTANGNVAVSNTSIGGNIAAGGTATVSSAGVGGTVSSHQAAATLPVDFTAEATRLPALSTWLASYAPVGTTSTVDYGTHGTQITLTGATTGLNVFDIDGSQFTDTNTFTLNLQPGATALINISGTNGLFYNAGMTINGGNSSNVLFNFYEATSLNFYGAGISGSVLAPLAAYTPTGYGVINGQVIVNSFSGSYSGGATQVNKVLFAGDLLHLSAPVPPTAPSPPTNAVPEPASWAMMLAGFGAIGVITRRRRRIAAIA